jgi:hypothetical protein
MIGSMIVCTWTGPILGQRWEIGLGRDPVSYREGDLVNEPLDHGSCCSNEETLSDPLSVGIAGGRDVSTIGMMKYAPCGP